MSAHQDIVVVEQLRAALERGSFPSQYQVLGAQLLDQLSHSVRIVVLGQPSSGKSSLINLMLGKTILGPMPGVDVAEVAYGVSPKTHLEWPDGTTRTEEGTRFDPEVGAGACRVRFELPDELLIPQSYFEINLPRDPGRQDQLFRFAVDVGQVFVWSSPQFSDAEQAIWRGAPDAIKDHSFLALTMADRQLMRGSLTQRIEELADIVEEEFLSLQPIATLHALAARNGDGSQSDLWETSGGRDLSEAITAQVRSGRAEELDKASILVAQIVEPVDEEGSDAHGPDFHCSLPDETDYAKALDHFQGALGALANELVSDIDQGRIPDASEVIGKCSNAVQGLTAILENYSGENEKVDGLLEEARDGEEMLMLLQVEQGPKAAEDAVFLMLQLRKEACARSKS